MKKLSGIPARRTIMKSDMRRPLSARSKRPAQLGTQTLSMSSGTIVQKTRARRSPHYARAARKAHKEALQEWERKHTAEHAAEVARAKSEYDAWEIAEIGRAD